MVGKRVLDPGVCVHLWNGRSGSAPFLFLANSPKDTKANAGFLVYTVSLETKI